LKNRWVILVIFSLLLGVRTSAEELQRLQVVFYSDTLEYNIDPGFLNSLSEKVSEPSIQAFYQKINASNYQPVINTLLEYKEKHNTDDWIFYQLIRRTAQAISPKSENYYRYTLYKWFLLSKSGYDATLSLSGDKLLFYVQCDENIYDIPSHTKKGKQYVCLNYHDYGQIDFATSQFKELSLYTPSHVKPFSYKITQLPEFRPQDYMEKEIEFAYNDNEYHFKLKITPEVKNIFANYPVVDYASYFNAPLSKGTYQSLIPSLRKQVKGMSVKNGVDYLMRFTRYSFLFEKDVTAFGKEKRLIPEQTLLSPYSDCEDRAALFFCLVKEIYNLPMIVLAYSNHVTIAVKLEKPVGESIVYKGGKYSLCEPTPQSIDLTVGQVLPELRKLPFEIAYAYTPDK
jgi:hypothetical protein